MKQGDGMPRRRFAFVGASGMGRPVCDGTDPRGGRYEMLKEFKSFLTKSNALALAVGVIIGAATGKVVSAVVDDLLMPVLGILLPSGDWREAKLVMKTVTDATGKETEAAILYGHLLGTVVDFVIIAFVVFMVTKALLKPEPAPPAPPTKECPECLESVPEAAKRCRACGTVFA